MRKPLITVFCLLASNAWGQSQEEIQLMRGVFAQLQPLSFEQGREYCGYVGLTSDGTLMATAAVRGRRNSCRPAEPNELEVIFASFHTHGAFEGDAGHEVPSADDMEADADEGIDGYVATPGGRLWYVDTTDMVTYQICGPGCLPQDPQFVAFPNATIAESYSYSDLVVFFD